MAPTRLKSARLSRRAIIGTAHCDRAARLSHAYARAPAQSTGALSRSRRSLTQGQLAADFNSATRSRHGPTPPRARAPSPRVSRGTSHGAYIHRVRRLGELRHREPAPSTRSRRVPQDHPRMPSPRPRRANRAPHRPPPVLKYLRSEHIEIPWGSRAVFCDAAHATKSQWGASTGAHPRDPPAPLPPRSRPRPRRLPKRQGDGRGARRLDGIAARGW